MSRAGIDDVLIANEVCGQDKIEALARATRRGRFTAAVDDSRNCDELDQAVRAVAGRLDVLIEVDMGMKRGGVRSPAQAVVAQHVSTLPGLRLPWCPGL